MLTITLPPEIEFRLQGEAMRRGIGAAEYACELIAEHLLPTPPPAKESIPEDDHQRGTKPVELPRKALFPKSKPVHINELPRWQPQVTLTRRSLDESDHV